MPTLYVENVPSDLYDALRLRAKSQGRSISAEVMNLLTEHVPTQAELAQRRRVFEIARKIRVNQQKVKPRKAPSESTEQMVRADRRR
jgi:plasmid stability protein